MIEHVRLLQISSEVFAKEVEPTGLLTMEQTLARSVMADCTVGWKGLTRACELLPAKMLHRVELVRYVVDVDT